MQDTLLKMWCAASSRWNEINSNERGATAVEYGLLVALIAAVIIGVVTTLGTDVEAGFSTVEQGLDPAPAPAAT